MKNQGFVGSVLVIKDNKQYLNYAVGMANKAKHQPNTTNSAYLINSIQKAMTATMFMQLVKSGKVKLTDKLVKFYPQAPNASKITMEQLLQMTSGLTYAENDYGSPKYTSDQAGIKYDLKKTKFVIQNYGKRSYQPINYVLLAGIIEKVTHKSYQENFNERIGKKLGLKHTAFVWSKRVNKINFAKSYQQDKQTKELQPVNLDINELHGEFGTGSLVMSNPDLYKVTKAMLNGTLLSKKDRDRLFVGSSEEVQGGNYGGGFYNFATYHAANGAGNGYISFLRISNDGKTAIIVQANYPIKSYFKMREEMNQLMENLLTS